LARPQRPGQVKSLPLHQAVARELGIAILSGDHPPESGWGGEIEHAAALNVSRTAYREAMRILTAKGMLESRPKVGTRITPRNRWNLLDAEVLEWMFSGRPDENFIRDLFELRAAIEPAAASLAAKRRSYDHLATMQHALDEMRVHGLATEQGRFADQTFHRAILEAADNQAMASLISSIAAAVTWTTSFKQRHQASPRDSLPDHESVFKAIEAGSSKRADQAMRDLLLLAIKDMGVAPRD
jgi:DNA-binding FadR family transcriptional regulator